jgi:hypothetical protein
MTVAHVGRVIETTRLASRMMKALQALQQASTISSLCVPGAHAEEIAAQLFPSVLDRVELGRVGGGRSKLTLSGIRIRSPSWCQPAPSHTSTPSAPGLSCLPISAR